MSVGCKKRQLLGYLIDENGTRPLPERVAAILEYKKPSNVSELRRFLGIINFYRRFIRDAATTQAHLNAYLNGAKKKDKRPIEWTPEAETAFANCKAQLAKASLLAHPVDNAPLILRTDASDNAIGAALEQFAQERWEPVGFFSKKLSSTQSRYRHL